MTFTITSERQPPPPDASGDTELTSAYGAALHIGGNCLRDGPVGQVGLEVEAHCFDLTDPIRRPGWDELTRAIAGVPAWSPSNPAARSSCRGRRWPARWGLSAR